MPKTTTVIVGPGQCGLAMSRCLAARSVDHGMPFPHRRKSSLIDALAGRRERNAS